MQTVVLIIVISALIIGIVIKINKILNYKEYK
jgi:hypothetical protein